MVRKNSDDRPSGITEALNIISPGTGLRTAIDSIVGAELGALIVVMNDKVEKIIEGGFRVNTRFTPQRLFELAKMDGAIVISKDMKKILYSNVLLLPNHRIPSNETGTRHKAAQRTAIDAETMTISVSERKKVITVFYKNQRYQLRKTEDIMTKSTENLQILDKERDNFDSQIARLNFLEINSLVVVGDVASVIQRAEVIMRISKNVQRDLIELGIEGAIISLRLREIIKNVEEEKQLIFKDYMKYPKKTLNILSHLSLEDVLSNEDLARDLFKKPLTKGVTPKGYRFLSKTKFTQSKISNLVRKFKDLDKLLDSENKSLSNAVRKDIDQAKEQIMLKQ